MTCDILKVDLECWERRFFPWTSEHLLLRKLEDNDFTFKLDGLPFWESLGNIFVPHLADFEASFLRSTFFEPTADTN